LFLIDLSSIALAVLAGFATHRASLCNVRAVIEILEGGRGRMLGSLLAASAWAALVIAATITLLHRPLAPAFERLPVGLAALGGFVFGAGAALNGGCSLSTLQRLVDGELAMLGTLLGFALGLVGWLAMEDRGFPTGLAPRSSPWVRMDEVAWTGIVLLAIFAIREAVRWSRSAGGPRRWHERILAERYQVSSAAAVLGLAGGALYALQGSWNYTYFVRQNLATAFGMSPPAAWKGALALAVLTGMFVSSLQRRSFRLRIAQAGTMARSSASGFLMGIGSALVPGGNDALLLTGIPLLSWHALLAYAALLAGIATVWWSRRHWAAAMP
jgi:uncharacterized membrane protein YedE/YeeE